MTELDSIRERSTKAMNAITEKETNGYVMANHWFASAKDVPHLLEIIEKLTPLIQAARNWSVNGEDTSTLEALVEASEKLEWSVLDALGIVEDDE